MKTKLLVSFLFSILILGLSYTWATHIRAGEIIARRTSLQTLTFEFTVTLYTDTSSPVEAGDGDINFGDGRIQALRTGTDFSFTQDLGNGVAINSFVVTHTFQGPGDYVIGFREFNRNERTLNMANSVNTPFYVETKLSIDPFFGINNSPVLTIPPVDNAAIGVRYIHNPGAYDPDGDSLAYRLEVPKQNAGRFVDNYRDPNVAEFSSSQEDGTPPALYFIDPIFGDLIWDAPGTAGQFNVAFIVEEWRKINDDWFKLGEVTRDMQIIVEGTDNNRPELILPPDTCVVAGTNLEAIIQGIDVDGDDVLIEIFGDPIEISSSPATYTPFPPEFQPQPGIVNFSWQTNCTHVRERPYQVRVKITDNPGSGPALVDIQTWQITVIGPPPTGLTADVAPERAIELNWDDYACQTTASSMQIWRRINSFDYTPDDCETGIRDGAGYELVDIVPISQRTYLDDNAGEKLSPGNTYCYRLVAVFPQPRGGESKVSLEACATLPIDAPVITNVSIENTSESAGEIFVRWTSPFEIDATQFPGPYTYEIIRATGFDGNTNSTVLTTTSDTTYTDLGLNTEDEIYNYMIRFYDANNTLVDSSSKASSVRLDAQTLVGGIELTWEADVPWSNLVQEFPVHYIYRNRADAAAQDETTFVLIDSVNVLENGFIYLDDGSFNDTPLDIDLAYCYYVETQGAYGSDKLPAPLLNKSQILCAQPNDEEAPCAPTIELASLQSCEDFIAGRPCGFIDFSNTITWDRVSDPNCDNDDVRIYRIYFNENGQDGEFTLVGETTTTTFVHRNLNSLKGCYRITAVDRSGNESEFSNIICNDNCPYYELPNAFTPNGDNANDTFQAYDEPASRCPRFVESVEIRIYDRWGTEVFAYNSLEDSPENNIFINWDGRNKNGKELSAGTYYYDATVIFDVLDPSRRVSKLKGSVQLIK